MSVVFGVFLLLVLAAAIMAGMVVCWRQPVLALPILVGGLAIHNFVLMLLLDVQVPGEIIRGLQSWKELILVLVLLKIGLGLMRPGLREGLRQAAGRWRTLPLFVRLLDMSVALFAAVLVIYTIAPIALGDSQATFTQRLLKLRQLELLCGLYVCGRAYPPTSLKYGLGIVVAVAAIVSAIGMVELFFIPTKSWFDFGILKFDSWLGFSYLGPGGLPENFFTTTTGGLLRRAVSTYLSPLGIAYTGILVVPIAFVMAMSAKQRRVPTWTLVTVFAIGLALSLTRLALLCVAVEAVALLLLFRLRSGLLPFGAIVAAVAFALLVYPSFGPVVSYELSDVRPPVGASMLGYDKTPSGEPGPSTPSISTDVVERLATADDASIRAHIKAIENGLGFVAAHPLGVGLGTSVSRYGDASGPGESAFFQIAGDIGWLGLVLFSAIYFGVMVVGLVLTWYRRDDAAKCAVGAVAGIGSLALFPIVLTSQVWGDFSVTFLLWWVAGSAVTLAIPLSDPLSRLIPRRRVG